MLKYHDVHVTGPLKGFDPIFGTTRGGGAVAPLCFAQRLTQYVEVVRIECSRRSGSCWEFSIEAGFMLVSSCAAKIERIVACL